MSGFLDIIQDWYDRNGDELSFDNQLYYLIELFQDLKNANFTKDNLLEVGERVLFLLDIEMIDESISRIHQRMLAEEINSAFRIVNKNIEEIKDEPVNIKKVIEIDDGDTYPNNTSEPDVDLRGIEWEQIPDDIEFLKELGIKK